MPETVVGYIDPATGELVFDEEVEEQTVQRIAKADADTGHLYVMYGGEKQRVTADPADGKLKINVEAEPMIFFEITVPDFIVSGETFDITVQAFSYGWSYEGGIPEPVTDYAQDCTLFFTDEDYAVVPTSIAANEWADGKVTKAITVTTEVAGESAATLRIKSDVNEEHTGFAWLVIFAEAPPVVFDVQASAWQLIPDANGTTGWCLLTVIARQLNTILTDYAEACSVSSDVGEVVVAGAERIEPEDWIDGKATVDIWLTDVPTPSSAAVITVSEVAEPAHQGQTTILLKVPEHNVSAWRYLPASANTGFIVAGATAREAYEKHTPELWYAMVNQTRRQASGNVYHTIPSGAYGINFRYRIRLAWRGYPVYRYEHLALEDWDAYVWDLQAYVGQNLNYLLEVDDLRIELENNVERHAPIIYNPGEENEPGWYEHDWNNISQQVMPNWTVSFRYDFWDEPRELWTSAYLASLPSAHTTTLHSLLPLDEGKLFIRMPFTTVPKRYLFFCPHIHLGSFPFEKAKVSERVQIRLRNARNLRVWSA